MPLTPLYPRERLLTLSMFWLNAANAVMPEKNPPTKKQSFSHSEKSETLGHSNLFSTKVCQAYTSNLL